MAKSQTKSAYAGWINNVQRDARIESRQRGKITTTQLDSQYPFGKPIRKIPQLKRATNTGMNLDFNIQDRMNSKYGVRQAKKGK